jgi:hypothetical protein
MRLGDLKPLRNFYLRHAALIQTPNLSNYFGCESRFIVPLTFCGILSALGMAIKRIGAVCSKKQMVWVYAPTVVAMVAHEQAARIVLVVQKIRNAVRAYLPPIPHYCAITITAESSDPSPTVILSGSLEFIKKAAFLSFRELRDRQCLIAHNIVSLA